MLWEVAANRCSGGHDSLRFCRADDSKLNLIAFASNSSGQLRFGGHLAIDKNPFGRGSP